MRVNPRLEEPRRCAHPTAPDEMANSRVGSPAATGGPRRMREHDGPLSNPILTRMSSASVLRTGTPIITGRPAAEEIAAAMTHRASALLCATHGPMRSPRSVDDASSEATILPCRRLTTLISACGIFSSRNRPRSAPKIAASSPATSSRSPGHIISIEEWSTSVIVAGLVNVNRQDSYSSTKPNLR